MALTADLQASSKCKNRYGLVVAIEYNCNSLALSHLFFINLSINLPWQRICCNTLLQVLHNKAILTTTYEISC